MIIENIDLYKLDIEDFGFILLNFHEEYRYFEARALYYGDFDKKIINRVLNHLKNTVTNEELTTFHEYKDNYDELRGDGIFNEMFWLEAGDDLEKMREFDFQSSILHLNYKQEQEKWKLGHYLFVSYEDVAFEIFKVEKTQIRIIRDFTSEKIGQLSLDTNEEIIVLYQKYLLQFGT